MSAIKSIKYRLIFWFLSVSSVIFTGLGIFLYYELRGTVIGSVDRHLETEIQLLASWLREEDEHGHMEMEFVELSKAAVGEYAVSLSGHYYQIVSSNGKVIARSPSLSIANAYLPLENNLSQTPRIKTITGPEKGLLRLRSQSFKLTNDTITIQAADTLQEYYHLLDSFRNTILIVFPLTFIFSWIGILIITDLSLRRLKILSKKVGRITAKNLNERLEQQNMDRELMPLVDSFNTMLGRLEESFNRQGLFLSDASHELRIPTAVIKTSCDVTLGRERTAQEYADALRTIAGMANRITDIINRILEVSRLESSTFLLKLSDVDLMDIVQDVVRLIEPFALSRGIIINLKGSSVNIKADRERLIEVFTNILDNAVKYNKPNGRVDIEVSKWDGEAIVEVADTGMGIPDNEKERIFDRFYRLDASRNMTAGSGLGLSIVQAIVKAHGGRVEVESKVNKGSCFIVYLPMGS